MTGAVPATGRAREARVARLLVAPAIALMLALLVLPVIVAFALSFTDYSLGSPELRWVGLDNYRDLVERRGYRKMFAATFTYIAIVVPLSVGLGLGAALLVTSVTRFGNLYRTIFFLPVMAALLAMAIVWEFALHPTIGIVNDVLERGCGTPLEGLALFAEGCRSGFPVWLTDRRYALPAVAFIGVWQGFGFAMVLYLAGLAGIPPELRQAAEIDGARSAWSRFRLVTWPLLGPTTVFVVTIILVRAFQVFDTVEAFYPRGGGPSRSVYVMMYAIYEKSIQQNLIGVGAAITVLFLTFVTLVTLVQRWWIDRRVHYA